MTDFNLYTLQFLVKSSILSSQKLFVLETLLLLLYCCCVTVCYVTPCNIINNIVDPTWFLKQMCQFCSCYSAIITLVTMLQGSQFISPTLYHNYEAKAARRKCMFFSKYIVSILANQKILLAANKIVVHLAPY